MDNRSLFQNLKIMDCGENYLQYMDAQTVQEEMENILLRTISFNNAYESFYHGFLAGIADKMYDRELQEDGYASIVRYGIAFCGKDCEVKIRG